MVINLKLNYLPSSLLQSAECSDKCNQILNGVIISGDQNAVSITSEYIPGTRYIFSLTIEFGRPYIAKFRLSVRVNNSVSKFFGGIGVQPLEINVEPSYLMSIQDRNGGDVLD